MAFPKLLKGIFFFEGISAVIRKLFSLFAAWIRSASVEQFLVPGYVPPVRLNLEIHFTSNFNLSFRKSALA